MEVEKEKPLIKINEVNKRTLEVLSDAKIIQYARHRQDESRGGTLA